MSASKEPRGLTLRQKKFVKFYVESGNGTEAAIKAGYSENCASVIASENLKKPKVERAIKEEERRIDAEHEVSIGWRLEMLKAIVQEGASGSSLSAAVSALAEINRMTGGHAPTKIAETDSEGNDTPKSITISFVEPDSKE